MVTLESFIVATYVRQIMRLLLAFPTKSETHYSIAASGRSREFGNELYIEMWAHGMFGDQRTALFTVQLPILKESSTSL